MHPRKRQRIAFCENACEESPCIGERVSRHDRGLSTVACRFAAHVLPAVPGAIVHVDAAGEAIGVPRRRVYDVVNVLAGVGVMRKGPVKNTMQWCEGAAALGASWERAMMTSAIDAVHRELDEVEELIANVQQEKARLLATGALSLSAQTAMETSCATDHRTMPDALGIAATYAPWTRMVATLRGEDKQDAMDLPLGADAARGHAAGVLHMAPEPLSACRNLRWLRHCHAAACSMDVLLLQQHGAPNDALQPSPLVQHVEEEASLPLAQAQDPAASSSSAAAASPASSSSSLSPASPPSMAAAAAGPEPMVRRECTQPQDSAGSPPLRPLDASGAPPSPVFACGEDERSAARPPFALDLHACMGSAHSTGTQVSPDSEDTRAPTPYGFLAKAASPGPMSWDTAEGNFLESSGGSPCASFSWSADAMSP